jgi:hypothetical protein
VTWIAVEVNGDADERVRPINLRRILKSAGGALGPICLLNRTSIK